MEIDGDSALFLAAVAGGLLTGLFSWLVQKSKGKVEETVAVRSEWAKLTDGLSQRLEQVEAAFAKYRIETAAEIAKMKTDHAHEIAEMKINHAAEMKAVRDMNESLQAMIVQNSRSSAQMIGDVARGTQSGAGVAKDYGRRRDDK